MVASSTWREGLALVVSDQSNPPGFYVLAKIWMMVGGDSEVWLRLLPCVLGIAVGPVALRFFTVLGIGWYGRLIGTGLVATSPLLVHWSVEFRGYAAFMLAMAIACTLTAQIILADREPTRAMWWSLWAALSAAIMFQYFAALTAVAIVIAAIWTGRFPRRFFVAAGVGPLLVFLPWATAVALEMRKSTAFAPDISWIPLPTLSGIAALPASFIGGSDPMVLRWAAAAMTVALVGWGMSNAFRRTNAQPSTGVYRLLVPLVVLPVLVALVASWVLPRSVWVVRYLMAVAVPFVALIALAIDTRPRGQRVLLALAAAWMVAVSVPEAYRPLPFKTEWRRLTHELTDGGSTPATVYAFEGYLSLPLTYYVGRDQLPLVIRTSFSEPPSTDAAWVLYRTRPEMESGLTAAAAEAQFVPGPPRTDSRDSTLMLRRLTRPSP